MIRLMKYLSCWVVTWALLTSSHDALAQDRTQRKAIQDSPLAYALFNAEGEPQSWGQIMDAVATADVVCFGELHDDAIMHWLQAEMVRDLLGRGLQPVLGAEMLEADDQLILDEFLTGIANEDKFKAAANLWPNHFTDYHPLLELAKEHELKVVATNVPRRYASLVYREGLEGLAQLSDDAKAYLPPLPIPFDVNLPGYQAMMWPWAAAMREKPCPWPKPSRTQQWPISSPLTCPLTLRSFISMVPTTVKTGKASFGI